TQVATGFTAPTVLEPLPDGRVLVGERGGAIWGSDARGAVLPTPLIQLPVDPQIGEHGLMNLALDPSFASNGWIYAYFTTTEPRNRVSRFTIVGDVADSVTER